MNNTIYLSEKQKVLILEALDMLTLDYDYEHPEQDAIGKLEDKIISKLNIEEDK